MATSRLWARLCALLVVPLAACAIVPTAEVPQAAISPGPLATVGSSGTSAVSAPSGSQEAAIARVIQLGNAEQEQALASGDMSVMRDTSTDVYFQQLSEANQGLLDSGAVVIKLIRIEWGPIDVSGDTATVTTYETWTTDFRDGTTDQSRDRNVYTLVRQGGAWLVQADGHPDAGGTPAGPAPTVGPLPPTQVTPSASPADQSRNWSGYMATGGSFLAVRGAWTVPEPLTTGVAGVDAAWVGIGGVRSRDLIQVGTQETVLSSGLIEFQSWIETLPQASKQVPLAVHAGDSVSASIDQQGTGFWLVALKNNTTGATFSQTAQYDSSLSSAEWVEEAPSGGRSILPLDNFGSIHFTDAVAVRDHQTLTLSQLGGQPVSMTNGRGQPLAIPSAISDGGAGFLVTRTANSSTGFGRGFTAA